MFESSETPIKVESRSDSEFVLGSAVPHPHELALGNYSVHTSRESLGVAESRILDIQMRLITQGRLYGSSYPRGAEQGLAMRKRAFQGVQSASPEDLVVKCLDMDACGRAHRPVALVPLTL